MKKKHSIERIDQVGRRSNGRLKAGATYLGFDKNVPIKGKAIPAN
jgi:hypothetical protein